MATNTLLPAQVRSARGLLDWSQGKLAEAAQVSLSTVRDFEAGRREPLRNNLDAIRRALEGAGVEFVETNGSGPGVRLAIPAGVQRDAAAPGWFKGWGVYRPGPWHFVRLFGTREEAEKERLKWGDDYSVQYGSHRLGSDDFIMSGDDPG